MLASPARWSKLAPGPNNKRCQSAVCRWLGVRARGPRCAPIWVGAPVGAAVTNRTMGVLGPPKPPAPLDVEPRWQQRRHTTWHGKQELRAHNRAFDASQLSKKRAQAQRGPPTPPRVDDKAVIRKARAAAHQRVLEYK